MFFGGLISETADITPDIKRRVRLAWVFFDQFKFQLYDMETAVFTLKVQLPKDRGDGDAAVPVCDMDPRRGEIRCAPQGAPQTTTADQ